jgi:hypothetical protein
MYDYGLAAATAAAFHLSSSYPLRLFISIIVYAEYFSPLNLLVQFARF